MGLIPELGQAEEFPSAVQRFPSTNKLIL